MDIADTEIGLEVSKTQKSRASQASRYGLPLRIRFERYNLFVFLGVKRGFNLLEEPDVQRVFFRGSRYRSCF